MITFTRPLAIAAGTLTAAGAALAVTLAAHGGAAPAQQPGSHPATTAVTGHQAGPANQAATSGSPGNGGSGSGTGGTGTDGTGSTGTGGTGTNGTGGGTNGTGGTGSGGGGGGVTSICQRDPSLCANVQRVPVALPIIDPPASPSPSPSLPPPTYCQLHPTVTICRP